jgi:hypothetical protein
MAHGLRIINIVGARPNLPKISPLLREMQRLSSSTADPIWSSWSVMLIPRSPFR